MRRSRSFSITNAIERAGINGDTLLLSEFGATDDPEAIRRMVERADRHMVSWQWWHYCNRQDPTTAGAGDKQAIVSDPAEPPVGANVFTDKLALIERPYPQRRGHADGMVIRLRLDGL